MAVSPRPHQIQALSALQPTLAVHDRAQLVMAYGTGKTLVARCYAQTSDADLVLVLLHRPVRGTVRRYCGCNDDQVTFEQHAWFDAVECGGCGAVTGSAIGD